MNSTNVVCKTHVNATKNRHYPLYATAGGEAKDCTTYEFKGSLALDVMLIPKHAKVLWSYIRSENKINTFNYL